MLHGIKAKCWIYVNCIDILVFHGLKAKFYVESKLKVNRTNIFNMVLDQKFMILYSKSSV